MLAKLFCSLALFIIALLAINVIHFRVFPVNVVFYSALLDVAIAVAISGLASWFVIFRRDIPPLAFMELLIIFVLGGYIWAISVPTIIDRSYSMYLLEKLQQEGGSLKQSAFDEAILSDFARDRRLTDARLTEQLQSGTIAIHDGCVTLTARGKRIASFTRWYRETLLPQHRLLMGAYTDDLTHPFRGPSGLSGYHCP